MRPDERLPTKRTASIGSRVPPAVTSTSQPVELAARRVSARLDGGEQLGRLGQAADPELAQRAERAGARARARSPRARAGVARLAWVAGCSYIALFMAGATISGRRHASAAAVSRLSAWPWASLASVLADAGRDQEHVGVLDQREVRERRVLGQRIAGEGAAQRVRLPLGDAAPARR